MAVAVTIEFPHISDSDVDKKTEMEQVVRNQVSDILNTLSAHTMEPDLGIKSGNDATLLYFTLIGDNKIDVASHIEEMVSSVIWLL